MSVGGISGFLAAVLLELVAGSSSLGLEAALRWRSCRGPRSLPERRIWWFRSCPRRLSPEVLGNRRTVRAHRPLWSRGRRWRLGWAPRLHRVRSTEDSCGLSDDFGIVLIGNASLLAQKIFEEGDVDGVVGEEEVVAKRTLGRQG